MKLESLKNGIFAESTIKREQMFNLNGGGTLTGGGTRYGQLPNGNCYVETWPNDTQNSSGIIRHNVDRSPVCCCAAGIK
jgi:hypothetical protein